MDQKILFEYEAKCVQEEAPACQSTCPLHVDARSFAKLMASGQTAKARQVLDKVIPLSCLSVFLCEGVCEKSCRVREISGSDEKGVDINLLERACVLNSSSSKMMPFPSSRKKIALIGAGLSSLILAYELNKKGHQCTIFHSSEIGADILSDAPFGAKNRLAHSLNHDDLKNALDKAVGILKSIKVSFHQVSQICKEFVDSCLQNQEDCFQAIFLSYDDSSVQDSDIFTNYKEEFIPNSLSLLTQNPKILCGGFSHANSTEAGQALYIQCIADGKRAAGSIERIMQGVDPSISREKENTYPTKLYTNLDAMLSSPCIIPSDIAKPSLAEALLEAKRCIDCSCLECLKQCRYLDHYKGYPKRYLREIYNNVIIIKGTRIANTMINTCTQCGLCEKICPQGLNMGTFIDEARRELVEYKRMPPSAHEFALDDMVSTLSENVQFIRLNKPYTFDSAMSNRELLSQEAESRLHDCSLTNACQAQTSDLKTLQNQLFMLFSGCQLPAVLPHEVQALYKHLATYLSVGFHFACCGIPAQWAGNNELLEKVIHEFNKQWEETGKPIYIFACSSCAEFFKIHSPHISQVSLWEILAMLPLPNKSFTLKKDIQNLLIHDPCSVREVPNTYNAVRQLLEKLDQDFQDFSFSKELTRCCGNGGLSAEVSAQVANTFVLNRMDDIKDKIKDSENNSTILLVYCAICRERFQKQGQRAVHLLELLFTENETTLHENMKQDFLKFYERQDKRLEFRKNILQNVFNEQINQKEVYMQELMSSIKLNINEDMEKILDERRILRNDILKVIWATLTKEEGKSLFDNPISSEEAVFIPEDISVFQNSTNSHCLAAYRPRLVTFWVEYLLEEDGSYTIFDAYSHRMIVPGVKGKGEKPLYKSCCNK